MATVSSLTRIVANARFMRFALDNVEPGPSGNPISAPLNHGVIHVFIVQAVVEESCTS